MIISYLHIELLRNRITSMFVILYYMKVYLTTYRLLVFYIAKLNVVATSMSNSSKKTILERLDAGEILIGDGGYITEMERRGYATAGLWTPEVNVEHPHAVEGLHQEFARAGSDVLQAFTFNANDHLDRTRTGDLDELNESACRIVKKVAAQYNCLWAGGLCATNIYGQGGSKKDVQKYFKEQAEIFVKHGSDFLIVEYFHICEEAEWAIEVVKETGKPVMASLCITSEGDYKGVPTEECAVRLVKAGADVIGVNCKFDPPESLKAVAKMKEGLEKAGLKAHLMIQPLGFHCPDADNKQGYLALPEYPFALEPRQLTRWDVHKLTRSAYDLGVRYFGGCCGFKAYHIRAISEELEKERGIKAASSEKHKPFTGIYSSTFGQIDRKEEYWLNLKPASGR